MKYYVNGKFFENEDEAKDYERELEVQKAKEQEKKNKEKDRLKELKELEKKYVEEVNKFYKDYGYYDVDLSGIIKFDRFNSYKTYDEFFNNFLF